MANRDYANNAFLATLKNLLVTPQNKNQVIDFATILFNELQVWGMGHVQPRTFSVSTRNMNLRNEKIISYPMTKLPMTYIKFQLFLDKVFIDGALDPTRGETRNGTNFNYILDETGMVVREDVTDTPATSLTVLTPGPGGTAIVNWDIDGTSITANTIFASAATTQSNLQAALDAVPSKFSGWTVAVVNTGLNFHYTFTTASGRLGMPFNGVTPSITFSSLFPPTITSVAAFAGAGFVPQSTMTATDGVVVATGITTDELWETAWNTLLRPYQNSISGQFVGSYDDTLRFPSNAWPYIRHTATASLFRLSPGQPDVTLITTPFSTGENNRLPHKAPRGPFIGPGRLVSHI